MRKIMNKKILSLAVGAAFCFGAVSVSAATLDDVKSKGHVQCGVSQGLPGFSNPDSAGNWTGMDVDVCRAIAAAVFGDADAVKIHTIVGKRTFYRTSIR